MTGLALAVGVVAALGACIGSFMNVVIYRVPRGLSVSRPKRSFCPRCEQQIAARHNVPIVSWILLSGRCVMCSAPIPMRYFLVEVITAVLFGALAWVRLSAVAVPGPPQYFALAIECLVVALIVAITVIDFQLAIIPDPLTVPWLPLLVLATWIEPGLLRGEALLRAAGEPVAVLAAVLAGVALGTFPALLVDFLARQRPVVTSEEPMESALPSAEESFSIWAEARWMLPRVLAPAALGGVLGYVLLAGRALDSAPLHAALASAAGVGAGLVLVFGIRFVFSALFRREAMGLGDAKFLALAGALLGAEGTVLVFLLACGLGSLPALGSLLRRLPGPTLLLLLSAALPVVLLPRAAERFDPGIALAVLAPIPVLGLLLFFRRLRRSDVPLTAMPFGPFLAVAALVLLVVPRSLLVLPIP